MEAVGNAHILTILSREISLYSSNGKNKQSKQKIFKRKEEVS